MWIDFVGILSVRNAEEKEADCLRELRWLPAGDFGTGVIMKRDSTYRSRHSAPLVLKSTSRDHHQGLAFGCLLVQRDSPVGALLDTPPGAPWLVSLLNRSFCEYSTELACLFGDRSNTATAPGRWLLDIIMQSAITTLLYRFSSIPSPPSYRHTQWVPLTHPHRSRVLPAGMAGSKSKQSLSYRVSPRDALVTLACFGLEGLVPGCCTTAKFLSGRSSPSSLAKSFPASADFVSMSSGRPILARSTGLTTPIRFSSRTL